MLLPSYAAHQWYIKVRYCSITLASCSSSLTFLTFGLSMNQFLNFIYLALAAVSWANAFPAHLSLGGLSKEQLDVILPRLQVAPPETPPGPLNDSSTKLVNDAAHPYKAPGFNDLRGPCPALNTLANHGVSIFL